MSKMSAKIGRTVKAGKGANSGELARKGLSKSRESLAPHRQPGMERVLTLQKKFEAMKSINAPQGGKAPATTATPLMAKHGGSKKTPTPRANQGEPSQVRFGSR